MSYSLISVTIARPSSRAVGNILDKSVCYHAAIVVQIKLQGNTMKFRIIVEKDELTIITQDGGIVCIREAEPISEDEPRTAVTDYYHKKLTEEGINRDNVFEVLAEGSMQANDWPQISFNDLDLIKDALRWLNPYVFRWELVDDLFVDLFGPF